MKEMKEQAEIISDFLKNHISDGTISANIISMTIKNGEKHKENLIKVNCSSSMSY